VSSNTKNKNIVFNVKNKENILQEKEKQHLSILQKLKYI